MLGRILSVVLIGGLGLSAQVPLPKAGGRDVVCVVPTDTGSSVPVMSLEGHQALSVARQDQITDAEALSEVYAASAVLVAAGFDPVTSYLPHLTDEQRAVMDASSILAYKQKRQQMFVTCGQGETFMMHLMPPGATDPGNSIATVTSLSDKSYGISQVQTTPAAMVNPNWTVTVLDLRTGQTVGLFSGPTLNDAVLQFIRQVRGNVTVPITANGVIAGRVADETGRWARQHSEVGTAIRDALVQFNLGHPIPGVIQNAYACYVLDYGKKTARCWFQATMIVPSLNVPALVRYDIWFKGTNPRRATFLFGGNAWTVKKWKRYDPPVLNDSESVEQNRH